VRSFGGEPDTVSAPLAIAAHLLTGQIGQGKPRLLVVDDQPINVQVLYQTFAADCQVFMATSGVQALALSLSKQPDLILLDVMMPAMDGYEVCERLKANPATRDIPVIFVTAHADEASEAKGLDVGAVDFISKPINPRIVRARVKTHLTLKTQSDLLRSLAYIDGLTGVNNRRHFEEHLGLEWGRAVRNKSVLGVVMLDVDFFKRYNDRYGHQAGDDCLRRVADTIKAALKRPADTVARYGGEEFVVLLPDTDLSGAMQVAESIGQQIFAQQIAHSDSSVARFVTLSMGVCCKPQTATGTSQALVAQADEQLYAAKTGGRHRVCGLEFNSTVAPELPPSMTREVAGNSNK
jgi:diguanylate cyclase (GGDEF)-like protein